MTTPTPHILLSQSLNEQIINVFPAKHFFLYGKNKFGYH